MARPKKESTLNPELGNKINREVAQYLTEKIAEREDFLRSVGAIFAQSVNKSVLAQHCGVSSMWITKILKGEKTASEEVLIGLANFLQLNQDELFRIARKVPPHLIQETKQKFLGELANDPISEKEINEEVGKYLVEKIAEREIVLKDTESIKSYSLNYSELGRLLDVSSVWVKEILTGNYTANEELLVKFTKILHNDQDELFRIARKVPPYVLDQTKREYLGEYYEQGC